jgi:hypothetical protein
MMNLKNRMQNHPRRSFLLRSAALLAAVGAPEVHSQPSGNKISLADFGAYPGSDSATIINAFDSAFRHLKELGGGTLTIAPGRYSMGSYSESIYLVGVRDLQNVEIIAYGAILELTTTGDALPTIPVFFRLVNPSNLTVRGLSFQGYGTNLRVHYYGPVCFDIVTIRPCSGIRTIDCVADHVVTFVRSIGTDPEYKYMLTDCEFNGAVRYSYYGMELKSTGRFSTCNLNCFAVKRGFIGFDVKDWDITINCSSEDTATGSNGFICLIPSTGGSVENCSVNLTATGVIEPYGALIHFYHQGEGQSEYMLNIRANVMLNNAVGHATVFLFDHALETGVVPSTLRTYRQITLTGTINGTYQGKIVDNPSVSEGTGNDIKVSSSLVQAKDLAVMPKYFSSFTPA